MTKEQDTREFDVEPSWWESWNDKDGYGVWPTRDEAECHCAHDAEPVPLYKLTSSPTLAFGHRLRIDGCTK